MYNDLENDNNHHNKILSLLSIYLEYSIIYGLNSKIGFFILFSFEILDILPNFLEQVTKFFYFNKHFVYSNSKLLKILLSFSPYQYYFNALSNISNYVIKNLIFISIYIFFYILCIFFIYILPKENFYQVTKKNENIFYKVVFSFYDFFFFRIFVIYGFDLFIKEIMNICMKNVFTICNFFILLVVFLLFLLFLLSHIYYYLEINILTNFHNIETPLKNFPFDSFFSKKMDIVFFLIKILIIINKNYDYLSENNNNISYDCIINDSSINSENGKITYISIFIVFQTLFAFYFYIFYLIYSFFFSYNCLNIFTNFYNKVRIFYLILISELLILRLILSEPQDFKSFLIIGAFLFIFDIYLSIEGFDDFFFNQSVKCQNFLTVAWFIQGNETKINLFITKWIINHKSTCIDNLNCPICLELLNEEINRKIYKNKIKNNNNNNCLMEYIDDEDNNKNDKYNFNEQSLCIYDKTNNIYNKKDDNKNKIIQNDITIISKLYNCYKFYLHITQMINDKTFYDSLSRYDLVKFDLIILNLYLFSNQNNQNNKNQNNINTSQDFIIFFQLCLLSYKYEKFINIFVPLRLLIESKREVHKNSIKNFDLLKNAEDLRISLNHYIKDYELFILYSAKTPENYLNMSIKYRKFKFLLKTIIFMFKKFSDCNYQLILMRYCYETLIHSSSNNSSSSSSASSSTINGNTAAVSFSNQKFDLNLFKEFLEFHFNNDKIILIKYFIDKDYFLIVKTNKEFMRYEGKNIGSIFPEYLVKFGVDKFKKQLKSGKRKFSNKDINDDENSENFITNNNNKLNNKEKNKNINKNISNNNNNNNSTNINKSIFEFVIKDLKKDSSLKYIESFKMFYFIYPANNFNEIIIQGSYTTSSTNYIIVKSDSSSKNYIYSFSYQLYKFIGLTPKILAVLREVGVFVKLENIFKKEIFRNKAVYTIFYFDYYYFFMDLLDNMKIKDLEEEESKLKEKLSEFENYSSKNHEITFYIKLKDSFVFEHENEKKTFLLYSIKENKKIDNNFRTSKVKFSVINNGNYSSLKTIKNFERKNQIQGKKKNSSSNIKNNIINNINNINNKNNNQGNFSSSEEDNPSFINNNEKNIFFDKKALAFGFSIISSDSVKAEDITKRNSSSINNSHRNNNNNLAKGKSKDKKSPIQNSIDRINFNTYIILIFNIVIIILSFIFLVIEINEINNFKSLFELFQTFKAFKRGIESSPLSLLSNFRFYKEDSNGNESTENIYYLYSLWLQEHYENFHKLPEINELIKEELIIKHYTILENLNNFQKELYKKNNHATRRIEQITLFSYVVEIHNSDISINKVYLDCISLYREYNNYISFLVSNNSYINETFSLYNVNSVNGSLTHFKIQTQNPQGYGEIGKIMVLFFVTYPSIHIGLIESCYFIQSEFDLSKNKINYLLIIFFIILIITHLVLLSILISFLYSYIKNLKTNITECNKLFGDRKYIRMQTKRIQYVKIINNLYSENPIKIYEKIAKVEEKYKKVFNREKKNTIVSSIQNCILLEDNNEDEVDKKKADKYGSNSFCESNFSNSHRLKSGRSSRRNNSNRSLGNMSGRKQNGQLPKSKFARQSTKSISSIENETLKRLSKNKLISKKKINTHNNKNNALNEEDIDNNNDSNIFIKSAFLLLKSSAFDGIIKKYKTLLYPCFGIYFSYCIIFFIIVNINKNKLSHLTKYSDINTRLDQYIYDTFNTIVYLYICNQTSYFYGQIIYGNKSVDYLHYEINQLYKVIQEKIYIEDGYPKMFPKMFQLGGINCTNYEEFIQDPDFVMAAKNLEASYNEYIRALCERFPIATTNTDTDIFYEILYMCEYFYQTFQNGDFQFIFQNFLENNQKKLYDCFTLILTFNKIIRTFFNDNVFPKQVNNTINSFISLIISYLVITVFFEILLFIGLNWAVLQKIKSNNIMLIHFLESLKF